MTSQGSNSSSITILMCIVNAQKFKDKETQISEHDK